MKTSSFILGAASLAAMALSANGAQAPVDLGTAGDFVILSKSGVTTTGATTVVGDIGVSPIDSTAITGFTLSLDASNQFATSPFISGEVYASDYAQPTPSLLTTAISDMENAFTNAAGRSIPDTTELGAGNISGMTLNPGLHKWGTGVIITSAVTFAGDANAVWILQIAEDLTVGNGAMVHLSGGARASNIFWQVEGEATLGTTSDFKGILMSQTGIHARTGASVSGRLLAQTAVTLDASSIIEAPAMGYNLSWFGDFNAYLFDDGAGEVWILHAEHGWLYLLSSQNSLWFWDSIRQSWFWTNESTYPYIYNQGRGNWDAYQLGGSVSHRWFFLFDAQGGNWVAVGA